VSSLSGAQTVSQFLVSYWSRYYCLVSYWKGYCRVTTTHRREIPLLSYLEQVLETTSPRRQIGPPGVCVVLLGQVLRRIGGLGAFSLPRSRP
jgi:hypothetical protein